ncbi:regulatory protein RecX [Tatumella sp. TA1]|uniref:regulatory protein RecX n=1 Tax=Rosenbergiella collisarenosi TaxID=1544695 RepID=UPI0008F87467|nr:regulatory protein RecX [Rosenbergiella collisarenosi]MBT0722635.1 regulatory protein RecX [Rosenbergiella collisarenosi]QGX90759.1 regulatory protein RecX [Tatumella sp. TA1]
MEKITPPKEVTYTQLLQRAVWILGQRDHGTEELREKLRLSISRKALRDNTPELYLPDATLNSVLEWCVEQGYLNDQRFCQHYISQRSRRGYGPQRVSQDLQRKGIASSLIVDAMRDSEVDWQQCAREVAEKKAGRRWPTTYPEKVKLQRYLYSRGFQGEDIRAVFENFPS